MAIWQYQIFVVPEEEINSYFSEDICINKNALNEIDWWKYRQLNIESFNVFITLCPLKKSWSNDIILFGDESSNCIELLMNRNKVIEISVRIDLRYNYEQFVSTLCEFAQKHNCIFLNDALKIISAREQLIKQDIIDHPIYKSFLDKLNE